MQELFKLQLVIFGRVHGVFFRESACNAARELGLVGSVENLPDGSVRAVAEGTKAALEKFKTWCSSGPELAKVDAIKEDWREIHKFSFKEFSCTYH